MRYVAFRWTPTVRSEEVSARAFAARLPGAWRTLIDWRGFLLLAPETQSEVRPLPDGRGVVLGQIWSGDGPDLTLQEDGGATVEMFARSRWGSYIAILVDRGCDVIRVLRSPDGAAPCFHTGRGDVEIVFSHVEDILFMAPDISPDLEFVAAFLAYPRVVLRRTGLIGVEELAPGECLVLARTATRLDVCWSPVIASRSPVGAFEEGACALRAAAEMVARALAREAPSVLHRLSGGFDSSAVLGLLARVIPREQIVCVNEYWPAAPEGDERIQARIAAKAHGVRLIELAMHPERVAYERMLAAPAGVKPTLAMLSFADKDVGEAYASAGASVLTSGRGGDHVFHRSRTAEIAADALRDGAPGLLTIALDTARLTRRSVWGVMQDMAWRGLLRRPLPAQPRSRAARLLADAFQAPDLTDHPWIEAARAETPARALRIGHLRDALSYHDPSITAVSMKPWPLFLAQPVVDACLRIAPYLMTQGGAERALARAAFSDLTPPAINQRVLKGETTRYFSAILAANRQWLEDLLRGGELQQAGLLAPGGLDELVRIDWRQDGAIADGLYSLIAAEVWLRKIKDTKRQASVHLTEAA